MKKWYRNISSCFRKLMPQFLLWGLSSSKDDWVYFTGKRRRREKPTSKGSSILKSHKFLTQKSWHNLSVWSQSLLWSNNRCVKQLTCYWVIRVNTNHWCWALLLRHLLISQCIILDTWLFLLVGLAELFHSDSLPANNQGGKCNT